jgi:SNF2 family DNA or RNA helicase
MPNKVLLFCVFDPIRDIVAAALAQNGVRFVNPKGGGARIDRAVAEFRACSEPCALLLAVKNAGQGLTLTEANKVIIIEPIDDAAQLAQVERPKESGEGPNTKALYISWVNLYLFLFRWRRA